MTRIEEIAQREVSRVAPLVDPAIGTFMSEMVDVGEEELALVTLVESASEHVSPALVDEIEQAFVGAYGEATFRQLATKYRAAR